MAEKPTIATICEKEAEIFDAYDALDGILYYIDEAGESAEDAAYESLRTAHKFIKDTLAEINGLILKSGEDPEEYYIFAKWLDQDYFHGPEKYICPAENLGEASGILYAYDERRKKLKTEK